ncbi:neuromedin Bb [Synchiropus splendidus]|uniref:neuromedin Bb n=1 Tax=Synchiropus splendidus TaxID=270530 RepID=UPI00237E7DA0|nr:neuromedin Bb [Synchiropus splendidus]
MRLFPLNVRHSGVFTSLLFFSFLSFSSEFSFDLKELRNKVARIKVIPRGNLWATGHFMGKKSVMETPLLPEAEEALSSRQGALAELLLNFLRDVLESQERRSKSQEAELLMKIMESYHRSRE